MHIGLRRHWPHKHGAACQCAGLPLDRCHRCRCAADIGEGPNLPFIFFNKFKQRSNNPVKLDISPHIFSKRQVFYFCFKGKRVGRRKKKLLCIIVVLNRFGSSSRHDMTCQV